MMPPPRSIVERLFGLAESEPQRVVYSFEAAGQGAAIEISMADLAQAVQTVAAALARRQLGGQRVLLAYRNTPDFLYAFYGCLAAGVVAVPVVPPARNRPDQRLQAIAHDAGARAVLTAPDLLDTLQARFGENGAVAVLTLQMLQPDAAAPAPAGPDPGELAFLQYTSGSTGTPKGVMISHANLMANSAIIQRALDTTPASRSVFWLPAFHDMGLIGGIIQPLYCGCRVHLMQPAGFIQAPLQWLRRLSEHRATTAAAPNFALELCCDKADPQALAGIDLSPLNALICGAEPVSPGTLARFVETFAPCGLRAEALMPSYGLAEGTLFVTGSRRERRAPRSVTLDARALEASRVQDAAPAAPQRTLLSNGELAGRAVVAEPTAGTALGDNQIGEIWISGPSVSAGYWQQDALNREAFGATLSDQPGRGPFFRTGDLGFSRDGELYVTGRLKDLIIVRGRNHHPQDIEDSATRGQPLLVTGAAAAFGVQRGVGEEVVLLAELSRQGLRELAQPAPGKALAERIVAAVAAQHEIAVSEVAFIRPARLLRTSSGKIQRASNRAAWLAQQFGDAVVLRWARPQAPVAPAVPAAGTLATRAQTEHWLLDALARRCDLPRHQVSLTEPFATYGLDSLAVVELMGELNARLSGVPPIDATDLYDHPTIERLLDFVFAPQRMGLGAAGATNSATPAGDARPSRLEDEVAALQALLRD